MFACISRFFDICKMAAVRHLGIMGGAELTTDEVYMVVFRRRRRRRLARSQPGP